MMYIIAKILYILLINSKFLFFSVVFVPTFSHT